MRVLIVVALAALLALPALAAVQDAANPDARPTQAPVATLDVGETAEPGATASYYSQLSPVARFDPGDVRDIKLRGDHAFLAGHSGVHVMDISDPLDPVRIGYLDCPSRDLDVVGDVLAVVREGFGSGCGWVSSGVAILDVSDPTQPTYVKGFNIGAHTITVHPTTQYIHVSSSDLVRDIGNSGFQDVLFAPTPSTTSHAYRFHFPILAENGVPVNAPSCHEITFSSDGTRAYCAAVTETHIWDTTDPVNIKVLAVIHNPSISIHHGAMVDADKELLVINDEFLGVLTNLADACLPASEKTSYGALWFYDISIESAPVPLSWINAPSGKIAPYYCTSHFGNILPNDEQLVWGWYEAGPVLVDFSDPLLPELRESFAVTGAHTWGAYHHDGYVYTGDVRRGFEVFLPS